MFAISVLTALVYVGTIMVEREVRNEEKEAHK